MNDETPQYGEHNEHHPNIKIHVRGDRSVHSHILIIEIGFDNPILALLPT